jgi:hypothetical protein
MIYTLYRLLFGGHIAQMREIRKAYQTSVGEPKGYSHLERPRCKFECNGKRNHNEIGCEAVGWFQLTRYRV